MPTSGVIRYTRFRRPASPSARFTADWAINPSFHLGGGQARKSTPQTGLRHISNRCRTEIGKWRAETAAAKPPVQRRNSRICQPETTARQPNPRECWRFSHTRKSHSGDRIGPLGWEDSNSQMRFQNWPLKCGPNFPSFRNVWRSETFPR